MQISAVIPSFNRIDTLERAISSILNQSQAVDEIILVDDGSTDNSAEFVSKNFPQVNILQQPNKGVSAARNLGINTAKHEWIALLDSDDSWLPNKIAEIHKAHAANPERLLIHSNEIWIRNGTRVNAMNKHKKYGGMIFEQCLALCVISPSATVIKKSLIQSLGLFDENLPACEDYDLWLRLCHNHQITFIEQALITKYGGHEDQLSRQFWGMDRFRIMTLDRLLKTAPLNPQQHLATKNMLIKKLEILIKGAVKHQNQEVLNQFNPILNEWRNHHEETLTC